MGMVMMGGFGRFDGDTARPSNGRGVGAVNGRTTGLVRGGRARGIIGVLGGDERIPVVGGLVCLFLRPASDVVLLLHVTLVCVGRVVVLCHDGVCDRRMREVSRDVSRP